MALRLPAAAALEAPSRDGGHHASGAASGTRHPYSEPRGRRRRALSYRRPLIEHHDAVLAGRLTDPPIRRH
jgi:hypothetical protein